MSRKRYPCPRCRTPGIVAHPLAHCWPCRDARVVEARHTRRAAHTVTQPTPDAPPVVRCVALVPEVVARPDYDILAYRAHKERQAPFDAQAIETARRLLDTELARFAPKRGRPRKVA